MAKKTRKQKQRAVQRRGPSVAPPTTTAPSGVAVEAEDLQPVAPPAAALAVGSDATEPRRRVERVTPAGSALAAPVGRPRPVRGQAVGYIQPLDSEEAAIPFDRVPYVPADLRRVAIIAALMILLIVIADIVVSNVVK